MPQRRYATAGAVLAATSAVAVAPVAPVAPWAPDRTAAARAVQLAAETSLLNVPVNLFQNFFNVFHNLVEANKITANSLFFTGNWFTPSATNVWGEEPADPGHFMAVFNYLFPFSPEISGLYQPEIDPDALADGTAGLGQQMAMFAAAWLPASASCDAIQCYPITPVAPITGITAVDRSLNFNSSLIGFPNEDDQLDLFRYWLRVPLQDLFNGYTFPSSPFDPDDPLAPGIANPVDGHGPGGSVPPGFGFTGTIPLTDADGNLILDDYGNQINLQPWAGLTFTFDPLRPFVEWFNSLMQPVDWSFNGDDPASGFHLPGVEDIAQSLKAVLAGLVVDFNPYVPGSPFCPGLCMTPPFTPPLGVTTLDLVKAIQSIGAPNPIIQEWIDLAEAGVANGPTDEQVVAAISALQTGAFTFEAETQYQITDFLAGINPYLPHLAVNSGLLTDPGILGPWPIDPDTGRFTPPTWNPDLPLEEQQIGDYGGLNPLLFWENFLRFLDPSGGPAMDLDSLWSDIAGWFTV